MADVPPGRPPRRPRYPGSHPRRFEQKYKELNPSRYADEVARVVAAGKTPAGMHRPIMVQEILEVLSPLTGEFAVDATLGYGGHTAALLERVLPGGRVLALDVDPVELPRTEARLRANGAPEAALIIRRSNFAGLARVLAAEQLPPADVVLADLGVSSMQLDDPARGFTFKREGPLDLRMNPQRGQPASRLLASLDASGLADVLEENGDVADAEVLARAIVDRQPAQPRSRRRPHWPKRLRRQWRRPSAVSLGRRSRARSERCFRHSALRSTTNTAPSRRFCGCCPSAWRQGDASRSSPSIPVRIGA